MPKLIIRRVPQQGEAYTERERAESYGLGDLIARATRRVGIEPCEPCNKRKRWLNRRVRIVRRVV